MCICTQKTEKILRNNWVCHRQTIICLRKCQIGLSFLYKGTMSLFLCVSVWYFCMCIRAFYLCWVFIFSGFVLQRLKVSCFRHEEFSSETSKPEAVDDVLHEDLQEPEINKPSSSKGGWVSTLQEVKLIPLFISSSCL